MDIRVKLLRHQMDALTAKERYVAMMCGVGSGKTSTVALIAIINCLQGKRVLVIERDYTQIRDVFYHEVKKQMVRMGLAMEGQKLWNMNTKSMRYMAGEIICRSAEGGTDAISGLTSIDTVIMDECSEIDGFQFFTECNNRMRDCKFPDQKKTLVIGVGVDSSHWFAQVAGMKNARLINACYRDNMFLTKEDIDDYDSLYGADTIFPEDYIKRYVRGQITDGSASSLFTEVRIDAPPSPGAKAAGYDVAFSGTGDDSVIAVMNGNILEKMYVRKTRGDIEMKEFQNFVDAIDKPDFWYYDSTGNAVVLKGTPVNFKNNGGQFANMRTKIYFDLKRALRDGIHVPQGVLNDHWRLVRQELDATSLRLDKETRLPALIGKDEIKKAIKRSPDRADALALACIPPAQTIDYRQLRAMQAASNPYSKRNF